MSNCINFRENDQKMRTFLHCTNMYIIHVIALSSLIFILIDFVHSVKYTCPKHDYVLLNQKLIERNIC